MTEKFTAVFTVRMIVKLKGVTGAELDNSEVLHPDVIAKFRDMVENFEDHENTGKVEVVLEDAYHEFPRKAHRS